MAAKAEEADGDTRGLVVRPGVVGSRDEATVGDGGWPRQGKGGSQRPLEGADGSGVSAGQVGVGWSEISSCWRPRRWGGAPASTFLLRLRNWTNSRDLVSSA